jgi:hypothetical protein
VASLFLAVLAWLWLLTALPFLTGSDGEILIGGKAGFLLDVFFFVFFFLAWCVLAFAWLLLAWAGAWRSRWWWAAGVAGWLGALLGVLLPLTGAGLMARVALSRPWLDAYVKQVPINDGEYIHEPRWVGLVQVDGTVNDGGAVFLYTGHDWINRHGIVYIPPDQESRQFPRRRTWPLLGRWHCFYERF